MFDQRMINDVVRMTDRLLGAEEFKRYIRDFSDTFAHMYGNIDDQAMMIIFNRALLLSVNDGDGYETMVDLYMRMWAGIYDRSEIYIDYNVMDYPELKDNPEFRDIREEHILREIAIQWIENETNLKSVSMRIFCLDISGWIDHIQSEEFRAVLARIRDNMHNKVIVFRIPAVDETTLCRVKDAISWYINVDEVYCPPHSLDDYCNFGLKKLKEKDIVLEGNAEAYFRELIQEAQKGPYFWGFRTVNRLIDDIMINTMRGSCQ